MVAVQSVRERVERERVKRKRESKEKEREGRESYPLNSCNYEGRSLIRIRFRIRKRLRRRRKSSAGVVPVAGGVAVAEQGLGQIFFRRGFLGGGPFNP